MQYLFLILILLTAFLFFYGLLKLIFMSNKRMQRRMKHFLEMKNTKKIDKANFNVFVQVQMYKQRIRDEVLSKEKNKKLSVMLEQAGVPLKPEEYVLFQWILTALLGMILLLITGSFLLLVIGAIAGFYAPRLWIKRKKKKRINQFNDGLPDLITTVVGSLRAGFSFPQALMTVVEEAQSPVKEEMERVLKEMQYGSTIEDSLNELKTRMPSEDLDLMIQAIIIQRQVGGNLATVLDKIVETIRDRTKIQRQITTLTAQGKLSGIIIGLLPLILAVLLYMIEPDYIGTLFKNPIGWVMIGAGGISGIIGFILIRKITTIEV
jgi:tight adherence protein B